MMSEICFWTAAATADRIRRREVSCAEVLDAYLEQIQRMNPIVNAIVTLTADFARSQAIDADQRLAKGEKMGPLCGLPVVHKDLVETKGIRTTYGSPIYRNYLPPFDALIVERLRTAGAITLGKSNTPEFGAGSQTFNRVFGATPNPYDLTKTCGGSSGGAAVSLACGMTALADGSDTGGSLRNPASFCNVVGLRPSAGRVPIWPEEVAWFTLGVQGPMGRTVEDVALMLAAIAGPDPRVPLPLQNQVTSSCHLWSDPGKAHGSPGVRLWAAYQLISRYVTRWRKFCRCGRVSVFPWKSPNPTFATWMKFSRRCVRGVLNCSSRVFWKHSAIN